MAFTGAPLGFHAASGEGYRLVADLILALDPINPQTAARFVPPLGRWRRTEPGRAALSPARNFAGILESIEGDRLRIVDEENRRIYNVRFGDIRSARLDFRWPDGVKGN